MQLAVFDLDNTLIAGDSDYLWGEYLADIGAVDAEAYRLENQRFFEEYEAGRLDIMEFLAFQLQPLSAHPPSRLRAWRQDFLKERIQPIVLPRALDLIDQHRRQNHTLIILTATNRFITEPIADIFGVKHLLATEPEFKDGRYTGDIAGLPCFGAHKVQRLEAWMNDAGVQQAEVWFYTDSHNDLPMMRQVKHPIAVDPDEPLREAAEKMGWPIISLRS
ncbi:MAG: HAD-IB family hydrolase [Gammaproteobacteria bacterium]|nr:MAG: HAD-IB family hydrolase [Gammaproteobacteria bacterium]